MVKSDLTGFGLCVVWPIAGLRHWADKEPTSANPNRGRLGPAKIKSEAAQCLKCLGRGPFVTWELAPLF